MSEALKYCGCLPPNRMLDPRDHAPGCAYVRIAELEAKVERLLRLIYVHVDPTGYEDDPDMQMAMAESAALEGKQDG